MKKVLFFLLIILLSSYRLTAQTKHENSVWFTAVNSTKINQKLGLTLDLQLLSADRVVYLKNFLLRIGFSYYIDKQNVLTIGYFQNQTYSQNNAIPFPGATHLKSPLYERQIWEQYIITHKINSVFAIHRLRLEQRFIERNGADDFFTQRFRYLLRLIEPIQKNQEVFKQGVFFALQDEVFLNIQNMEELNGSLFDQNRVYIAAGYRFSPKFDIDAGYVKQVKHGAKNNTVNDIAQLVLYTRF